MYLRRVAQLLRRQRHLLVRFRVHEHVLVAAGVQVLHFTGLDVGALHPLAGPERALHHVPVRTFFSVVRTNAAPLPGLTCRKSTTLYTPSSRRMVKPLRRSLTEITRKTSLLNHADYAGKQISSWWIS